MERIPEPEEVMEEPASVAAYNAADFAAINQEFVEAVIAAFGTTLGKTADLGCGPGDIAVRLALAAPQAQIWAIDASQEMLKYAAERVDAAGAQNVHLLQGYIPGIPAEAGSFNTLISNSLLHQLPDPNPFWAEIRRLAAPDTRLYIKDLLRPDSEERVREIVQQYAGGEPEVHQQDFYNSLLAAFTIAEVNEQLQRNGLGLLRASQVSDRHWVAQGIL